MRYRFILLFLYLSAFQAIVYAQVAESGHNITVSTEVATILFLTKTQTVPSGAKFPIEVQVSDRFIGKHVVFSLKHGAGKFEIPETKDGTQKGRQIEVRTDSTGRASAIFKFAPKAGPVIIQSHVKNFSGVSSELPMTAVELTRWRYRLDLGVEFNEDLNNGFGKKFLNLGLTTNTHWGHSFHTEFEARLTSVLQRDLIAEVDSAVFLSWI